MVKFNYILIGLVLFILSSFSLNMEVKKDKVKFKNGYVLVNGDKWGKIETIMTGGKYAFSTLSDKEYLVLTFEQIKTGEYWKDGKEKFDAFLTMKFLGDDIEKFEMEGSRKSVVRALIKSKVIEGGEFNKVNALKFKEKYEEDISSKYKKEERIIIIK